jgi:DNA-binding MarR family transcriptional regulator
VRLWMKLFLHLRRDTNEITATNKELAEAVGATPAHISEAMREFEKIGAVERHREGRRIRYFMNPRVGTHLTGAARDKAQITAPRLVSVD